MLATLLSKRGIEISVSKKLTDISTIDIMLYLRENNIPFKIINRSTKKYNIMQLAKVIIYYIHYVFRHTIWCYIYLCRDISDPISQLSTIIKNNKERFELDKNKLESFQTWILITLPDVPITHKYSYTNKDLLRATLINLLQASRGHCIPLRTFTIKEFYYIIIEIISMIKTNRFESKL